MNSIKDLILILSVLLITSSTFSQHKVNTLGQFKNTVCIKFVPSQTKQLDKSLQLSKDHSKIITNKGYVRTEIPDIDKVSKRLNIKSMKRIFRPSGRNESKHRAAGLHLWYQITYDSPIEVNQAIQELKNCTSVTIAHAVYPTVTNRNKSVNLPNTPIKRLDNKISEASSVTSDPRYREQWHYNNTGQKGGTVGRDIHLEEAWEIEKGDSRVIVVINDNGLDTTHPDLIGNLWVNEGEIPGNGIDDDNNGYIDDIHGYNFIGDSGNIPSKEHGTHVAGTVAAETNNGIGVAGVAGGTGNNDGVRLMACTFVEGNVPDIGAEAFVYAADNGAVISQNSWMYWYLPENYDRIPALEEAMDYFRNNAGGSDQAMDGGVIFFAAGNENNNLSQYPHNLDRLILVAALDNKDQKTNLTNYGTQISIAAPGAGVGTNGILSTFPNEDYGYLQGTSMACPHVSGVAALVLSNNYGDITPEQLKRVVLETTDPIDHLSPDYEGQLGTGRVNAYNALQVGNGVTIPLGIRLQNSSKTTASIRWNPLANAMNYTVRYKKKSVNNWITVTSSDASINLSNLEEGQQYVLQVSANNSALYSYKFYFTTAVSSLSPPSGISFSDITDNSTQLSWNATNGASGYILEYKKENEADWISIEIAEGTMARLESLSQNTGYEIRIKAINQTITSSYSTITYFKTKVAKCGDVSVWTPKQYKVKGTQVAHNDIIYENKWWAQSTDTPGNSEVWEKIRNCDTSENELPIVSITSPVNGQAIKQETLTAITLSANASDSDGTIDAIQFEVNGTALTQGNNISWTPAAFGDYTIKVTATDDKGATTTHQVNITIQQKTDNQLPTVNISQPTEGQIFEQEVLTAITLSADASDTDGTIASVQFEINGTALTQGNNISWTPAAFGDYTIKVTATDDKGATATHQVNITIQQKTDNQPPTVNISQPTEGQIFEQEVLTAITLSADASDTDGTIASVQFEINGTALTQGNNISWTPTAYGDYTIKVTATDDKGATAMHQVGITIKETNTSGNCNGIAAWDPSTIYPSEGGVKVSHNNSIYENKWWTQNEEPGTGGPWGSWELISSCHLETLSHESSNIDGSDQFIRIYPNPTKNVVHITVNIKDKGSVKITLQSILGKEEKILLHKKMDIGKYNTKHDISFLPKGVYILKVDAGNQVQTKKIVIN